MIGTCARSKKERHESSLLWISLSPIVARRRVKKSADYESRGVQTNNIDAPLSCLRKTYFFARAAPPRDLSINGAGHQDREWISCGPFLAEAVEVGTADRLSQAGRLPQAGMLGMLGMQEQEPVGSPELGQEEEGSHPSLPA